MVFVREKTNNRLCFTVDAYASNASVQSQSRKYNSTVFEQNKFTFFKWLQQQKNMKTGKDYYDKYRHLFSIL